MKRIVPILTAACMILALLIGCAPQKTAKEYDIHALAKSVADSGSFTDILSDVSTSQAVKLYKIDESLIKDCAVYCSTGATTEEIGIFQCADEDSAGIVVTAAKARAEAQKVAYESYAPGEIPKLDDAVIESDGVYVFYIVSDDPTAVAALIK